MAATAEAKKEVFVAVDDGFAMTDVIILEGGKVKTKLAIPSRARSGLHGIADVSIGGDRSAIAAAYETEGTKFTVGDFRDSESAKFDDYPFSTMNRVIINHALRLAGLGGRKVRLATGLPISMFYKDGQPNKEIIERKNASIRMKVAPADGSATADIIDCKVFPEGLAAWIDYAVDEKGEMRPGVEEESIAVVDIGGKTTDVAVVLSSSIDFARSGSANIGVLDVIELIAAALAKRFNAEVAVAAIDKALRTKEIKIWGKTENISAEIDRAAEEVLDRILREVNRRLGNTADIDKILLVGGGAHIFQSVKSKYPNPVEIPADPEFANARGFAKYLEI